MFRRDTVAEMDEVLFFELCLYSWGSTAFKNRWDGSSLQENKHTNSRVIQQALKFATKVKCVWKLRLIWIAVVRHETKCSRIVVSLHTSGLLCSFLQQRHDWTDTHCPHGPQAASTKPLNLNQVLLPSQMWLLCLSKMSPEPFPTHLLSDSW